MMAGMSKFAVRKRILEEERAKGSERRMLLGKYLYNISLACFTVLVLGTASTLVNPQNGEYNTVSLIAIAAGVVTTVVIAYIANKITKC